MTRLDTGEAGLGASSHSARAQQIVADGGTTNAALRHRSAAFDVGAIGGHTWSRKQLGYLPPAAMAYALALWHFVRGDDAPTRKAIVRVLETNQAAWFKRALASLRDDAGAGALLDAAVRHIAEVFEAEVLALVSQEPLRFSSSALLRPVIQDSLLPTAAYVGGPGEINYFAQLGPLYELFGVAQPLVLPRARFRCLEDNTRSWLAKLGLSPAEAEVPRAELLRRLAARAPQGLPDPAALRERMLADITTRLGELEALDSALRDPVRRARESIERTVGRLTDRYAKALLERDHVTTERVDRVQGFLLPDGVPQERFYSLPYFACKYGASAFKQKLFAHLGDAEVFVPAVRSIDL